MENIKIEDLVQRILSEGKTDEIYLILALMPDAEIKELIMSERIKNAAPDIKSYIICFISKKELIEELLENPEISEDIRGKNLEEILKRVGDNFKLQKLQDKKFCEEKGIGKDEKKEILKHLSKDKATEILSDKRFMLEKLELTEKDTAEIILLSSSELKISLVLRGGKIPGNISIEKILSTVNIKMLIEFIKKQRNFWQRKGINIYEITSLLDSYEQLVFISELENVGLSMNEKMQVLATLKSETKEKLDISGFKEEYIRALNQRTIQISPSSVKVKIDFNEDLEKYRGLDEALYVNPMQLKDEEKEKLDQLFEICPKIKVMDDLHYGESSIEEYKVAEKWIEDVLQQIDPNWTTIQKIAYIDWAIGKKISYSPDFNTEVFNEENARGLWKIIASGYGVCDGIAQVEVYMLRKLGIKVEIISSKNHSFLKVNDIEIPCSDGRTIRGDTIIDPTWNLADQRYGAMPQNFCKSYVEIRKNDIDVNGVDSESHKNDELLTTPTISLDFQSLKEVFKSVGIADKEGNFPIKDFIYKSVYINYSDLPTEKLIKKQLNLLAEYCPEFATCQNETTQILSLISLNSKNLNYTRCIVNRVYARGDDDKRPILYVYADLPESGKKFYFADSESRQFIELQQREFEERFECYQTDLEKNGGQRPWEESCLIQNKVEDLESSGDEQTV